MKRGRPTPDQSGAVPVDQPGPASRDAAGASAGPTDPTDPTGPTGAPGRRPVVAGRTALVALAALGVIAGLVLGGRSVLPGRQASAPEVPVATAPVGPTPVSEVPVGDPLVSQVPDSQVPVGDAPVGDPLVSTVPVGGAPTPVDDPLVSPAPVSGAPTPVGDPVLTDVPGGGSATPADPLTAPADPLTDPLTDPLIAPVSAVPTPVAAASVVARSEGSTLVVTITGAPTGTAAQLLTLNVAAADACPGCWSRRVPVSGSAVFVASGTGTFRVPDLVDGSWQARLVSLATSTPELVAASEPTVVGDGVPDLPATSLTATASGSQLIVTILDGPVGPTWSPVYLFIAPADACATCWSRYAPMTSAANFVQTGAGSFVFPVLNGTWRARLVTDAPGRRTVLATSEPVTVADGPAMPTPELEARVVGNRIEVTVRGGPVGELWNPTWLFLATPADCPTCRRQYLRLSDNPSFVSAGAGTFSFTAPPGDWQARLVTDAPGTRTVLATSPTVKLGLQPG